MIRPLMSGYAGRLFIWFWLSLMLVLIVNFAMTRYLERQRELRDPTSWELRLVQRVESQINSGEYNDPEALLQSHSGRALVLIDATTDLPVNRQRLYWHLAPLTESQTIKVLPLKPGHNAIGPFTITVGDSAYRALWLLPPRAVPPWRQLLYQSPYWRLAMSAALVLVLAVVLARRLSRPVRQLREMTRRLGEGDLSARVPPIRGEMGLLGRDFNAMAGKLQAAMESQRRLVADVSHELRSPLTRLKLASDLLSETTHSRHLDRISRECDALEHLIEQVLTLARLEGSVYQERWEQTDIAALINAVVDDWRFQRPERRIEICGPDRLENRAKPHLLRRVLDNLVSNATRYAPTTRIQLEANKTQWRLIVEDDGPGVDAAQRDRLLQPFYRVDEARSHDGNTGLGLTIAQAAARAQAIEIELDESDLGGLKVVLTAPRDVASDQEDN